MNFKLLFAALIMAPLALTACSKKNDAPVSEQGQTAPADEKITPEQQAAIDALDKPVMDEKNTDVSKSVANAAADPATPLSENEAPAAQNQDKAH